MQSLGRSGIFETQAELSLREERALKRECRRRWAAFPRRNCFIDPGDAGIRTTNICVYHKSRRLIETIVEGMMETDTAELDQMQTAYKAAVEEWLVAIEQEEALASVNHTVAEVDKWEGAHFAEEELRNKVKAAKKKYEDALREKFFGF
jgi:hypothetical protein